MKLNILRQALLLVFAVSCTSVQTPLEKYMIRDGRTVGSNGAEAPLQGMAVKDGWMFCLEHGGHALVYRDKPGRQIPVGHFDISSSAPFQHANCVNFGNETAPGASFPLLYITNGQKGGPQEFICFVESITMSGSRRHPEFSSEQVQAITADTTGFTAAGLVPFFGCPSWQVDAERGFLWIFSARKRTIPSVTCSFDENEYIATKYRIPRLSEGEKITLGVGDVLDQVLFKYDTHFTQGGCAADGKIYFCFGADYEHNPDGLIPQRIRIYNTDTGLIEGSLELFDFMSEEPEDLCIVGKYLYLNTNSPYLYRIRLKNL